MLSGQPGSPQDAFTAGHFALLLDRWAAAHAGIAPILVVPDQLGARSRNPMCVDSPLGNSATYLTVDVPAWIRSHFSVQPGPEAWTFAGYSQGGTCSAQLGGAHPELYGTILDIAGEEAPHAGSIPHTIASAFGGSAAAYAAAAPAAVLAAHAPYRSLLMILAAGSDDTRYLPVERRLAKQAAAAGAAVRLVVSPGTSHDWYTVRYAFRRALPLIVARAGSS
jgi:enterochelin esterase-like enzyme